MEHQKGFLLVSMLLAVVVIGLIAGGVYLSQYSKFNSSSEQENPIKTLKKVEEKVSQNTTSTQGKMPCDLNSDALCDDLDLEVFNKKNGTCSKQATPADANQDGCVDLTDRKLLFQK